MTRTTWRKARGELVSNAALRAAAERRLREGWRLADMLERAGISHRSSSQLSRSLGLLPDSRTHELRERIWSCEAARLCRALDVAPVEVGL
jgi:hypothetical protein